MYLEAEAYIKIREQVLEMLHERYPGLFIVGEPWDFIALFPPKHEEVGYLKLYQDIDFITYVVQFVNHGHLHCPQDETPDYTANYMKWSVVELLEDLFNDNILFGVDRGLTFSMAIPKCLPEHWEEYMEPGVDYFVWSGPVPNQAEEKGNTNSIFRNRLDE